MSDAVKKPEQKKNKLPFFKILFRVTPLVFRVIPGEFLLYQTLGMIHSLSWAVAVFANQRLYDALSRAAFAGGPASEAFLGALLAAGVTIACQVFNGLHNFWYRPLYQKTQGRLSELVHHKAGLLRAELFEDKEKLDDINKAVEGMGNAVSLVTDFFNFFTFYLPYFLFLLVYFWRLKPLLDAAFIIIFIPVLLSQVVRAKFHARLEDEAAPLRRESDHYEDCLCSHLHMKETRLLGAYRYFKNRYMETIDLLAKKQWAMEKRINTVNLGLNLLTLGGYGGILWLLFSSLMAGDISVGAFAAVYASAGMLFSLMNEMFDNHLSSMSRGLGSVNNFIKFLDLPNQEGEQKTPDFSGGGGLPAVAAEHLSFTYPGAEKPSVVDLSLEIRAGETVAIVGENGSGKSTLVKLISGLYAPSAGRVSIGGVKSDAAGAESLYANTSAVFQSFERYKLTLGENIRISDLASGDPPDRAAKEANLDAADAKTFPQGKDTILSREFEGVDLSGGQWQRVAIARGLYRKHGFILLDEPTAAIDPIEETRVYRQFAAIAREITAVIVTHRLGSARIADRILVMDEGRIVESGGHEELVARGGKYAQMWAAQAKYYREGGTGLPPLD